MVSPLCLKILSPVRYESSFRHHFSATCPTFAPRKRIMVHLNIFAYRSGRWRHHSSIQTSLKQPILYVFQRSDWSRMCHVIWRTSGDVTISYCFHVKVGSAIGRQVAPILYVFQRSDWSRMCHVIWRTSGDVTRCRLCDVTRVNQCRVSMLTHGNGMCWVSMLWI